MKKLINYILPLLILTGCSQSFIKLTVDVNENINYMFGQNPARIFFVPVTISDSLKKLWDTDLHGGLTNSSVTVLNNYIFVNDLSGWITSIDLKTGKIAGELKAQGAVFSSPVLHGFNVIYPLIENNKDYSLLVYYDFKSAKTIAEVKIKGKIICELARTNNKIIFNSESGVVYAFDLKGNEIWKYDTKTRTRSSPAVNNGIIVFGNNDGEIIGLNENEGIILYREKIGSSFYGSPSISGDTVYIGDNSGKLHAVNLKNGNIFWQFQTSSRIISLPVFNSNTLFVCNLSGELYALNKSSGSLVWEKNLGGLLNVTPLLTNDILIVPDLDGKLFFVNVKDGKIDKEIKMKGRSKLSPTLAGNKLIVGYDYHTLAAYEIIK